MKTWHLHKQLSKCVLEENIFKKFISLSKGTVTGFFSKNVVGQQNNIKGNFIAKIIKFLKTFII